MPSLTPDQLKQYEEEGYIAPIDVLSKEEAKDCSFSISIELTIFETKIPLLFIAKSVPKTRLPPIVTVFTLVPKAISISTKSSLGIPGGAKVKESFVAQKTPA